MAQHVMTTGPRIGWPVLAEVGTGTAVGDGAASLARQALLVALGVAALALAAKVQVPMWPSPVPVTMGTFAVLGLAAAYGPRLGPVTIGSYLLLGALGADVFVNSSGESNGLAYMLGGTGGYLVGYLLSALLVGVLARRGWDRRVGSMALAMLLGNVLIYVPGLAWLHYLVTMGLYDPATFATPWAQTLQWGLTPYLIGDAMKLALAALLLPAAWRLMGPARG